MGDRVAVMRDGRLQQVDVPQALYEQPANVFVGGFIGSPAMNLAPRAARRRERARAGRPRRRALRLPQTVLEQRPALDDQSDGSVIVGIRPEDIEDAALLPRERLDARRRGRAGGVDRRRGDRALPARRTPGPRRRRARRRPRVGVAAARDRGRGRRHRAHRATRPTHGARSGEPLRVSVDVERLHFFDPAERRRDLVAALTAAKLTAPRFRSSFKRRKRFRPKTFPAQKEAGDQQHPGGLEAQRSVGRHRLPRLQRLRRRERRHPAARPRGR